MVRRPWAGRGLMAGSCGRRAMGSWPCGAKGEGGGAQAKGSPLELLVGSQHPDPPRSRPVRTGPGTPGTWRQQRPQAPARWIGAEERLSVHRRTRFDRGIGAAGSAPERGLARRPRGAMPTCEPLGPAPPPLLRLIVEPAAAAGAFGSLDPPAPPCSRARQAAEMAGSAAGLAGWLAERLPGPIRRSKGWCAPC
jgi:hypothetical protein